MRDFNYVQGGGFDENENFIDWTPDLGDVNTKKLKLKLNNGQLKLDEH